jgi:hypothetical protein
MNDGVVTQLARELLRPGSAWGPEVLDALVPWLVLSGGLGGAVPSPALLERMSRFCREAGLDPAAPAAELQAGVDAWFEAHPLPEGLLQHIAATLLAAGAERLGRQAERASVRLGATRDLRPVAQRGGEGARLGSLAQFAFRTSETPARRSGRKPRRAGNGASGR